MFKSKLSSLALGITVSVISISSFAMSTFGAHPPMTKDATKYLMWQPEALQLLLAGAVYPDREHNTTLGNKEYFPSLHFDRYKSETNLAAFKNGYTAYKANLNTAIEKAKVNDLAAVYAYLGGAIHAVEDFGSHSNYIELPKSDQKIIDEIFWGDRPYTDLPKSVLLTHYDPDAKIPGIPEGSNYPHNIKSKDYPHRGDVSRSIFPDGTQGYQHAYDAGVIFARKVLTDFMLAIPEEAYRQVTNAQIWNVFPAYGSNCVIGDINKTSYTAMREDNIMCDGKPVQVNKLSTAREVGINTFKK